MQTQQVGSASNNGYHQLTGTYDKLELSATKGQFNYAAGPAESAHTHASGNGMNGGATIDDSASKKP